MGVLFELLLIAGLMAVVARRVTRLLPWLRWDPAELSVSIKRRGREGVEALARAAQIATSEADLQRPEQAMARLAVALGEPTREARAAACNEALLDLEGGLGEGIDREGALVRVAVFGTLLALVVVVLEGRSIETRAMDVLGLGGGALLVLAMARREGRKLERQWREGMDAWVAQSLLASGESEPAKVDRRRRSV